MRVLVTGATGFVGQHLVPQLLSSGHDVCILVREIYGMGQPLPAALAAVRTQVSTVYADLRNYKLTARAVQEVEPEVVVHLAAVGVTNPFLSVETALRHNLNGTIHLIRACFGGRKPVRQLVVARTPGEKLPSNVYAASKAAAWNFCEMFTRLEGWPIHGAMLFQTYGPGQPQHALVPSAIRAALAGEDFPMTSGAQKKDWIYVDDVVRGLEKMLDAEMPAGATVDLGTGKATAVADVVEQIYEMVGGKGQPRPGLLSDRPGEPEHQVANAGHTRSLLGWTPNYTLRDGLQHLLHAQFS